MDMKQKTNRKKKDKGFRLPCGWIALGGTFAIIASPVTSSPFLCACIGVLAIIVSFALALCHRLDDSKGSVPWWWGSL